jgi:ABC-type transport system involved in multi-copper enzyme maturation permease subunit
MNALLKNPLLKKEIRLLLPAWGLTLLLAVVPTFLFRSGRMGMTGFDHFAPVLFGILILCASSFGREFSLGTFATLLAQPFSRKQFWFFKVGVLLTALASVLAVYVLGMGLFQGVRVREDDPSVIMAGIFVLAAIAGGLWLALWIRQMVAVFWLIVLVPFLLSLPCLLILSHFDASDKTVAITLELVLLAYAVTGIAGSWLIFRRAQDAPWSGGAIILPEWMSTRITLASAAAKSSQTPWRSLVRKELQFNQVALLGMGVLFLLQLGVVGLRYLHQHPTDIFWRDLNSGLEAFGSLWVMVPLIVGCTSVAEERRLGTMEGQLCQPSAIVRQFWVKLGFTLVVGGLLSTFLLLMAEGFARVMGLTASDAVVNAVSSGALCALAMIGFFASTLTRNLLQALAAAVATALGIGLVMHLFSATSGYQFWTPHLVLWNPLLPDFILGAILAVALPWLAYPNFRCLPESARVWRRNGLVLTLAVLFAAVTSAAIYHRVWDIFTPFEPAHGSARWTQGQAPAALRTGVGNNLLIALPDGRIWYGWLGEWPFDRTNIPAAGEWPHILDTTPAPQLKISEFMTGSNWVSLTTGTVDAWVRRHVRSDSEPGRWLVANHGAENVGTVGIQANGTLWVSDNQPRTEDPHDWLAAWNTNQLVQFGTETNWMEVAAGRSSVSVLLLKDDGTVWRWGNPPQSQKLAASAKTRLGDSNPVQIGTNSDWQHLAHLGEETVEKKDGTVWGIRFNSQTGVNTCKQITNSAWLESYHRTADTAQGGGSGLVQRVEIRANGTLWISGQLELPRTTAWETVQCGRETNWVAAAAGNNSLVALKNDGTLWKWGGGRFLFLGSDAFTGSPRSLGVHHDWVALANSGQGVVSLAADGSLWLWPNELFDFGRPGELVEPSSRPVSLGNILAAN